MGDVGNFVNLICRDFVTLLESGVQAFLFVVIGFYGSWLKKGCSCQGAVPCSNLLCIGAIPECRNRMPEQVLFVMAAKRSDVYLF